MDAADSTSGDRVTDYPVKGCLFPFCSNDAKLSHGPARPYRRTDQPHHVTERGDRREPILVDPSDQDTTATSRPHRHGRPA